MHVIVAGSGDLARYICEEFTNAGHHIILLTRESKSSFDHPKITQYITDYTIQSLRTPISKGEVLISTIADFSDSFVDVHRVLIQACQESPTCRRFIPSEFAGEIEFSGDPTIFYHRTRDPIRRALKEQTTLEWTLVSIGWFADYIVPAKNRYIKDIGESCPVNVSSCNAIIPGTGDEPITFTWARDVARALAVLVDLPEWEPYTYLSGEQASWNLVVELMKREYLPNLKVSYLSVTEIEATLNNPEDNSALLLADHNMYSVGQGSVLPKDRVRTQREAYFAKIHFRTLKDGLADFRRSPDTVV